MNRRITRAAVVGTFLALACNSPQPVAPSAPREPVFEQAPNDGNGTKQVIRLDDVFEVDCGAGHKLTGQAVGWIQIRTLDQQVTRTVVGVNTVNIVFTFTNSAGATFTWREVGADVFTVDENGFLLHALVGRAGGFGIIGRFVIDEHTGEIKFVAGNNVGHAFANACAALT